MRLAQRVPDERGADALAGMPARRDEEDDVQLGLVGRADVRLRSADDEGAERLAVVCLGDPKPAGALPFLEPLDEGEAPRDRLAAPLTRLPALDHPRDRLVHGSEHRVEIGNRPGTDPHAERSSAPS